MCPIVSIGMPVYNGEKFIREALDSLLAQTFTDFELIISDNASTDGTEAICREYAVCDSRIRYVRQSENRGACYNFQFVLDEAKGEYFMWAAADDKWDKEWITVLLHNFEEGVFISFGHVANINEIGENIRHYKVFDFSGRRLSRMLRFYMTEEFNGKANVIYGLYRTDMIRKYPIKRFNSCSFGNDFHFIFNCLQYGNIKTDTSVFLWKRIAANTCKACTFKSIVMNIFLLERLKCYIFYVLIASNSVDKLALTLLFPVKYVLAFFFNMVFQLKKILFKQS
ncbi:MAG: glycosyltransferase family 2 protein [Lutibacter sp.]|jgi:glycosyltransferase involved in cell wall biosynthesis